MARLVFIVQGEGRGHLSQSLALAEYLEKAGHEIEAVFAGCRKDLPLPAYFREFFKGKLHCFSRPYFLRTRNRKGLCICRTFAFHLIRTFQYLSEIKHMREKIRSLEPDVVVNFYDLLGALALRRIPPSILRVGVGHHFYHHLEGYRCPGGHRLHKRSLKMLTSLIMGSCDRVLALSFREARGNDRIRVVPPLVRKAFRQASYRRGSSYLVYLLSEGFVEDLSALAREDPSFEADLFSDLPADTPVPGGIRLHALDDKAFLRKMSTCRALVCTSGFDAVAEAATMGVPVGVMPVRKHFEQACNSADIHRSGIGKVLEDFSVEAMEQIGGGAPPAFREWVSSAGEHIIRQLEL
jgi:uncharacterized protein (TIGR00661 family)